MFAFGREKCALRAFENSLFTEEPCKGKRTFYVVTCFINGFSFWKIQKAAMRSTYVSVTELQMLRSLEQNGKMEVADSFISRGATLISFVAAAKL